MAAFASPLELQFRWAKPLNDAMASDEKSVLMRAATLAALGTKLPAKEVFERLTQLTNPGVEPFNPPAPIDVQASGKSMATVQLKQSGLSISFKKGAVPEARVPELVRLLEDFLSRGKPRK
jgi:ParB family chromosome partitioning protein